MSIEQITRWKTSDGKEHTYQEQAEQWETKIKNAEKATNMLKHGSTIAECLKATNYQANIDPILETITKNTKLIISYWQCCNTPRYKPTRIRPDGQIVVYGCPPKEKWGPSPYGGAITIQNLIRYATETLNAEKS